MEYNTEIKKEGELTSDYLKRTIKWMGRYPNESGGQSCGKIDPTAILHSDDLAITIEVGYHRGQLKNQELAYKLFELLLTELNIDKI